MQFMAYASPPSNSRPEERAAEREMRTNNDQIHTTNATVTSVAAVLNLVIAKTGDDLKFHLSPQLLLPAVENLRTEGVAEGGYFFPRSGAFPGWPPRYKTLLKCRT